MAVIGADEGARAVDLEVAEDVGRRLARHRVVIVCGGLGGVMEAACRGAHGAGATTIGLLPGLDRAAANPHVTIAIPTGLGEARNALVVRAADAVIAVGGGYGTLSEIALALRAGKPVVGLDTWEVSPPGGTLPGPVPAADAGEAVRIALAGAVA